MLRNMNLHQHHHPHHQHHHHHHLHNSTPLGRAVTPQMTTTLSAASAAVAGAVETTTPALPSTPAAASVAISGGAAGGFSIYSPNISFEQDYRSNYTHHNAQIVIAASNGQQRAAVDADGSHSMSTTTPEKSAFGYRTTTVAVGPPAMTEKSIKTSVVATADLMAGLERKGFYIVKSTRIVNAPLAFPVSPTTLKTTLAGPNCNNNSATMANNNLQQLQLQQQKQQHQLLDGGSSNSSSTVSKGMVESLHNYSKQRCEEEMDRLRRKCARARFADDDDDEDDENDDDDEEDEDEDGDDEIVDVEGGAVDDVQVDDRLIVDAPQLATAERATVVRKEAANSASPVASPSLPAADEKQPEHHARRPMNAFLIFCKRHRGIVREKYPNLENRAITKILGDWWANIDVAEKEHFNRLAREYKDAFFSANPTFQWYKLPAPPLRTLTTVTRPSNGSASAAIIANDSHYPARSAPAVSTANNHVGMFKLADTAQMGGLNDLMHVKSPVAAAAPAPQLSKVRSEADKKNSDLQAALGDVTTFFAKTMSTNRTEPFRHYRQGIKRRSDPGASASSTSRTADDAAAAAAEPPAKRSISESSIVTSPADFERFVQANFKEHLDGCAADPFATTSEDEAAYPTTEKASTETTVVAPHSAAVPLAAGAGGYTKSSRACKGKRYLEFINTVRVATVAPKRSPAAVRSQSTHAKSPIASAENGNGGPQRDGDFEMFDHMYASPSKPATAATVKAAKSSRSSPNSDSADFDLDGKIKALDALSLDEYLSRKRDTKKKKKITTKPKSSAAKSSAKKPSSVLLLSGAAKRPKASPAALATPLNQRQHALGSSTLHVSFAGQEYQQQQQQHHAIMPPNQMHLDLMRAQSALERREQIRQAAAATAVGSQKRKARKESITRRDIAGGCSTSSASSSVSTPSPTEPVASPDLLILAQVAAIITSK